MEAANIRSKCLLLSVKWYFFRILIINISVKCFVKMFPKRWRLETIYIFLRAETNNFFLFKMLIQIRLRWLSREVNGTVANSYFYIDVSGLTAITDRLCIFWRCPPDCSYFSWWMSETSFLRWMSETCNNQKHWISNFEQRKSLAQWSGYPKLFKKSLSVKKELQAAEARLQTFSIVCLLCRLCLQILIMFF